MKIRLSVNICFWAMLSLAVFESCKPKEKSSSQTTSRVEIQEPIVKSYFNVSFFSIGTGVDGTAIENLQKTITNFETSEKTSILTNKVRWGREGETDYCMDLFKLTARQQKSFKQLVKETLSKGQNIHITEEAQCR